MAMNATHWDTEMIKELLVKWLLHVVPSRLSRKVHVDRVGQARHPLLVVMHGARHEFVLLEHDLSRRITVHVFYPSPLDTLLERRSRDGAPLATVAFRLLRIRRAVRLERNGDLDFPLSLLFHTSRTSVPTW